MCDRFKKLPNDPLIKSLKREQMDWIIWNINREIQERIDHMGGRFNGISIGGAQDGGAIDALTGAGHG